MQNSLGLSILGIIATASLLIILTVMFFRKNKQVMTSIAHAFKTRGQQVIYQVAETTQEKTSKITEEAIDVAVDQAIHVIQTASQRVRESRIPTENVKLEVSIKVVNLAEVKMQVEVPTREELADANSKQKSLLSP